MLKSRPEHYGAVPVTIHWLTAILILALLGSGFQAGSAIDSATKAAFLRFHIPVAIIILLLTLFRIVWWWFFDRKPAPVQRSAPIWQERLARVVHIALYIVIFGMVATGIVMIALSGAGPIIFGGEGELPDFLRYPPRIPHGFGAILLSALLVAHVGAALWHHFIRRDGLLWRMWYGR